MGDIPEQFAMYKVSLWLGLMFTTVLHVAPAELVVLHTLELVPREIR